MTKAELVALIANMTPYTVNSDDDKLEDCIATMNRLIQEAKETQKQGMMPCKFTFDDGPAFSGFAEGTTWNGFDNVSVTPEVRDAIAAWFTVNYGEDSVGECPVGANGLVSLANGFATQIIKVNS